VVSDYELGLVACADGVILRFEIDKITCHVSAS